MSNEPEPEKRPRGRPPGPDSRSAYWSRRNEDTSEDAREIGPPPDVVNGPRRASGEEDLAVFLKTYFPNAFPLPWCPDHLKVISALQTAIVHGGLFAMAMPRGSGKTTIAIRAAIYAILYGYRRFVCLIAASEPSAKRLLRSLQDELRFNELLAEDFPEALHCLRALEGEPRKCKGQMVLGERTETTWSAQQVRFPTLPPQFPSKSTGAVISVAGITGEVRGQQATMRDGKVIRPEFVILDDPQTRESAMSESQCAFREGVISGDVLGMAGPGVKIAAVMPCTVVRRADMADRMLDKELHPDWNGEKTAMVYAWPTAEKLWDEYFTLRVESLQGGDRGRAATEFYRQHQQEMDAGSCVAWPERFNPDELSAIQHAMNLRARSEVAFFAEYQNQPLATASDEAALMSAEEICRKLSKIRRGVVPRQASRLTAFIDVQKRVLWWLVAAWEDDFTGYVVDYGSWPDQGRSYYTMFDLTRTIESELGQMSLDAQCTQALNSCIEMLCGRDWERDQGGHMRIDKLLVDANWGDQSDTVYKVCRETSHTGIVSPSHGKFVGATGKPFYEYDKRQGDRQGLMWRISRNQHRSVPHVLIDVNWWKTFVHNRLRVPEGGKSELRLFGDRAAIHQMLADHLRAEQRIVVTAKGRSVDEWKLPSARPDNHWFDCLVGSAVAASILGCALNTPIKPGGNDRHRPTMREMRGY
jgi:hypothetical protein